MNEKDVDWRDLQLFLAVAREGGLSPAAKRVGRSAATLSRRMLSLEAAGSWTTLALMPHIHFLQGEPADILLRFIAAEATLDILHREVVIGFRNKRPIEESLVCRKLAPVEFAPYGLAEAPLRWVKVLVDTPSARWVDRHVGADALCEVNAPRNSLDLALAGAGIALLPTFVGDAQPTLVRRGKVVSELSHDRWLVVHQQARELPPVRRAIDRLCEVLA